jgi:hypothetical protein
VPPGFRADATDWAELVAWARVEVDPGLGDSSAADLPAAVLPAAELAEPEADGLAAADADPPDAVTVGVGVGAPL